MAYPTLAEFKTYFQTPGSVDTEQDANMQRALDAAIGSVEFMTGRTFLLETAAVKYFTAVSSGYLDVIDLIGATEIAIDTNSDGTYPKILTASQYQLEPFNEPRYQRIVITPLSTQAFWPGYRVRVTGDWGLVEGGDNDPPATVQQAILILAARYHQRKDAPFGIIAGGPLGDSTVTLAEKDPDVYNLLSEWMRSTSGSATWVLV